MTEESGFEDSDFFIKLNDAYLSKKKPVENIMIVKEDKHKYTFEDRELYFP